MRKVLFVVPLHAMEKGGAYFRLQTIVNVLGKRYEVCYFTIDQSKAMERALERQIARNRFARRWFSLGSYMRYISLREKADLNAELNTAIVQQQPDVLIISGADVFPWIQKRFRVPTIMDAYDIMWVLRHRSLQTKADTAWRRLRAWVLKQVAKAYDRGRYKLADQLWVVSKTDAWYAAQTGWRGPVRVVPNAFSSTPPVPVRTEESLVGSDANTLFFIGTMSYRPNIDGVKWFLKHCWPLIHAQAPHLHLRIAGKWQKDAAPKASKLPPNVEILGFVEDPEVLWADSFAFICPLRLGTGTRLKILEAWARRVPVISTTVGIEGLEAQHEQHALIADQPEALANAVLRLASDGALRLKVAQAGYEHVRANFAPEHVGELALRYCDELLAAKGRKA
jgi:glycosyltransferase involved in cell wall biosynthesis